MENRQGQEIIGSDMEQTMNSKREADKKILANIVQNMGSIPNPLKLMAERPGTVETFMAYRNQIFEGGPLGDKERSLIAMATAVAMKSAKCIRTHANKARKAGASEDEVMQTILIANLMMGASPLHTAYAAVGEE